MDHKTWLWRKKPSEKAITADDKANPTLKQNEEVQELLADKEELEKDLKNLNDRLALALSDCNAKDELVNKQTKIAQEAVAGWEKAKAEALSLKQGLEEALQQKLNYEDRITHLDGALKECMQQLRFVREEQEKRILDAVTKASKEFEKARMVFEEQLSETSKKLANAGVENAQLSKTVLVEQTLIEDLKKQLTQAEADHNALMARLESTEKDNTSLKYEVRVLEKEVEIRNEEREFNRRSADASHKQHLESAKKIAKLESECQRLRLLVRKRLPGPAALAKMKNEVEMLGRDSRDSVEMRRKRSNSISFIDESSVDGSPGNTPKRISILTEQLFAVEEENKTLKEALSKKTNELQFSRTMLARTAFKLSQIESQLEESSKGQATVEQPRSSLTSHEFPSVSMSDIASDDKASSAESWASALISELEQFRNGKQKEFKSSKSIGCSDINLMDDFVEMEKLAIVSVEKGAEISHTSSKAANGINGSPETRLNEITSPVVNKEIIPVSESSGSNYILNGSIPVWLQEVLKVVLEQSRVTHRKPDDILEETRVTLRHLNHSDLRKLDQSKGSDHVDAPSVPCFGHSLLLDPSSGETDAIILAEKKSKQQSQSDMSKSIGKIIEIIERISTPAVEHDNSDPMCRRDGNAISYKNLVVPIGYTVRVFQWKTSELTNVLHKFLRVCYDLLNGKADHEKFAGELTTALDWIMNHCFSIQDVSSMKDAIKKQFDWEESRSESEAEIGMMSSVADMDKLRTLDGHELETKELQYNEKEESGNTKDKVICAESKREMSEWRVQAATNKTETLRNQLQESEKIMSSELLSVKKSDVVLRDQTTNPKLVNADLDAQLTEDGMKEAHHKVLTVEMELENKNHCCEKLEGRCIELQLLLQSVKKESSNHDTNQKEKPLRTDWEITAASEKLAECQETILNLGKQLKALADPKDASLFDSVIATKSNVISDSIPSAVNADSSPVPSRDMRVKHRSSLLDQMLAEDDTKADIPMAVTEPLEDDVLLITKDEGESAAKKSLAIVPVKKKGGASLWKKLLWRKKVSAYKKTSASLIT